MSSRPHIGSRRGAVLAAGLLLGLVVTTLLALPAAPSDGAIFRLKEARFEIHVKLDQRTEWRHPYQHCDLERYQQGSQAIAARTPDEKPQRLHFMQYGDEEMVGVLENSKGKPASYLLFGGSVNRSFFDSREGIEGCEVDPPAASRDCGEKAIELALATVEFGEVRPPDGGKLKNRLSLREEYLGADESYFAPYENCPTSGWSGLMPFHDGPLSPREVFGDKRKLELGSTTAERDGTDDERYTQTILESEIMLKRVKKRRGG